MVSTVDYYRRGGRRAAGYRAAYRVGQYLGKRARAYLASSKRTVKRPRAVKRATPFPKRRGRGATSVGNYGGRVAKFKKTRQDPFKLYGSEYSFQAGGEVTDTKGIGVGHSTMAVTEVHTAVCRGIMRKVFANAGITFSDWNDSPVNTGNLELIIQYKQQPDGPTITSAPAVPGASDYETYATILRGVVYDVVGVGSDFIWESCQIRDLSLAPQLYGKVNLVDCVLVIRSESCMTMQNRTISTTAGVGDETNALDVAANPLMFRGWECKGNSFLLESSGGVSAPVATGNYGWISTSYNANASGIYGQKLYSNAYKSGVGKLAPGQIKTSKLKSMHRLKINDFYTKLRPWLENNVGATPNLNTERVVLGKSKLFELEKMCDTREVGEPSVTVGFEITTHIASYILEKKYTPARRVLKSLPTPLI